MQMNKIRTEVVIIGGGIIGILTACALARSGVEVVVIERRDMRALGNLPTDGRAISLASASVQIINQYGLWDNIIDDASPIEQIRVCDGDSPLFLHFDNQLVAGEPLGFMVDHSILLTRLYDSAASLPNLKILSPAIYTSIERDNYKVTITTADNCLITAELLIAADGKHSQIRKRAGIRVKQEGYEQTAMVCDVRHELDHQNIAIERFLPAGPFAILPLKGGHTSCVVWTEKKDLVPLYLKMSREEFTMFLRDRFTEYLGELEVQGEIFSYPLNVSYARTYYDTRLALVGDAAHAIHPIAGQGLNMGIRDVDAITSIIKHYKSLGLDLGGKALLADYQAARRSDNMAMVAITDIFNKLFSNNTFPLTLARRIGLATVNKITPLQKFFMKYAMGVRGSSLF